MDKDAIFISIITSLLAAIVFWIFFDRLPSLYKILRIRPRVEKDLSDINLHLFFFIQIPFLHSLHTASLYQREIDNGKLKKIDFENALYGKCLSPRRCVNEFAHRLLAVGEKLKGTAYEIDKRIDRIQKYDDYLSTKEILLLKEIEEGLHTYEYDENNIIIEGVELGSVDPTISYMSGNFYELYCLYLEFTRICDSFCFLNRNEYQEYRIAKDRLENGQYLKLVIKAFLLSRINRELIKLRYYYIKGNLKKAKSKLKRIIRLDRDKNISIRLYFDYLINESELREIIVRDRGEKEVEDLISIINSETVNKKNFELRNAENKVMIKDRVKNTPKITEYNAEQMRVLRKVFDGYL